MNKILLLFLIFCIASAVNAADLSMKRITIISDPINKGEDFRTSVVMQNTGLDYLENVRVTVYAPDLDIRMTARSFDLHENERISRRIAVDVPWAEPGLYLVRFTASDGSGSLRKVKHRWVEIG